MSTLFKAKDPVLEELEAAKARLNAEAQQKFDDPAWRKEMAQAISEEIYEGFEHENIVDLFTDVERVAINGRSTIKEVRGLKAYHTALNGYIEESTLHSEVMEIEQDFLGFHVVESQNRLALNFAETADTLVNLGQQRLDAEINNRVLSTFQAAVGVSHPSYVASTGLSLATLNSALAAVKDASLNDEVTIVGRHTMTDKIVDALTVDNTYALYTPQTNEDLLRRGVVGAYRQANIITLKNYLDADGNSYFPANELWVIGRNAGKTAFFGGPETKSFIEDDNWIWHYIYRMSYGVAVTRPDRLRRIVDGTQAP